MSVKRICKTCGWYADRAREVMRFCDDRGIECHIKAGTLDGR